MKFRKYRRTKFKNYKKLEEIRKNFDKFAGWEKLKKYENNKRSVHSKRKRRKYSKQQNTAGIISLPSDIDFKDNIASIGTTTIPQFKYNRQLTSKEIKIDLSKLNNISINGLLYLISEIDMLQNAKFKNRFNENRSFKYISKYGINRHNMKLKHLLNAIGYWDYFNIKKPYSIDNITKNNYFLSIKSDIISKTHYVADLRNFISEKINFIENEIIQDYFDDAITEVMANSVEHGYINQISFRTKGKWWLCGHYDNTLNILEFSFRDYGVGLRKTLEYNSDNKIKSFLRELINTQKSDADIIKLLINDKLPKYKDKKDKIRGYGFKSFKMFAKNIGYDCEMSIVSGKGKYVFSYKSSTKNEKEETTDMKFEIHGFSISWKIYIGENNETNNRI